MRMHIIVLQESDSVMRCKLIIDGNAVYEIDEECLQRKQNKSPGKGASSQEPFQRPEQENGQSRL